MATGVNKATSNADRIKVGDYRSAIELSLTNTAGDPPTELKYIRLTKSYEEYVDITDYTIADGKVSLRLPAVPSGFYSIEIKDAEGRIYPAEGTVSIHVVKSIEGGKEIAFAKYSDVIIGEIPALVDNYVTDNQEILRGPEGPKGNPFEYEDFTTEQLENLKGPEGPKGDPGEQGEPGDAVSTPPKTYTRAEYDALESYDDNTLYIVKGA